MVIISEQENGHNFRTGENRLCQVTFLQKGKIIFTHQDALPRPGKG